jgi:hypothetical protein
MIGQFIALLFLARDLAHREHLRVRGPGSYARHMALGEFYVGVIGLADTLAESYQGRFGIIEEIPLLENEYQGSIIEILEQQLQWLEANRYKAVPKEDSAIQNVIDEVVNQYLSTLYKLKNLA